MTDGCLILKNILSSKESISIGIERKRREFEMGGTFLTWLCMLDDVRYIL